MQHPHLKPLLGALLLALGGWAHVAHGADLTLQEAMQEALQRYPAVQATLSQRASAQAEVDKAEAARWPVLSMGATAVQSGATARSTTPQASYALYAGGGIEAGVERARELVRAAEGKLSATQDEVAQQAGEAYLSWARALAQLALARQNLLSLEQIRSDVATIVEVDRGRLVDLNQATVRLQSARLSVTQRETELAQARWRLERYLSSPIPPQPAGLDTLPPLGADTLEQALQTAQAQHPLMVQAQAQVEAARAGVTLAQAQTRPRLDLSVMRQMNPYALSSQTLSQLTLSMPVFNGGAGQAGVRGAVEQLQAAQSNQEEQALLLREKIGAAWAEWQMAGERVALSQGQARAGEQLVDNYRAQFRLARRSLLDLLNVQNEVYGYQSAAVQADFDVRMARLRLASVMGRLAETVAHSKP